MPAESITLQVRGPFATELTVLANKFKGSTKDTSHLDKLKKQRDGFNPLGRIFNRGRFTSLDTQIKNAEKTHNEDVADYDLLIRLRGDFDLEQSDEGQYTVVAMARDAVGSRINQFSISLRPPDYKPFETIDSLTNTRHVGHDPLQPDREALGRIARRILLESQPVTGIISLKTPAPALV